MNRILTLCFVFLALIACSNTRYLQPNPYENPDLKRRYIDVAENRFPASFTSQQRIVLSVGSKEYDFIGFLAVRGDSIRAVAMNEFGGKMFDLLDNGSTVSLLTNAPKLPENPIIEGVAGDLRLCFRALPASKYKLGLMGLEPVLTGVDSRGAVRLFEFSNQEKQTVHLIEVVKGEKIREANIRFKQDYREPVQIEVVNHKWHYSMNIQVLKIEDTLPDEKLFENTKAKRSER